MKRFILLVTALLFAIGAVGCNTTGREYHEDIVITLQESSDKLIIKEWCYLLGSGAEVYYQKDNTEPVLLGKTTGGDDGFCPFKEGLYEIKQDGNILTVAWCFNPADNDKTNWRSETFDLTSAESVDN